MPKKVVVVVNLVGLTISLPLFISVLDPCESDPCVNGGTCVVVDPFSSMCMCLAGYSGPVCEVNIDECLTADCSQGTSCQDGINSFQCIQQSVEKSNLNYDLMKF